MHCFAAAGQNLCGEEKIKTTSWRADLALLGVTLIWGATFVMVKEAVAYFPVFAFLTLRFSFALLSLVPFLWSGSSFGVTGIRRLGRTELWAGGLVGLALLAGYGLQTAGLRTTSAAKTGFITGLSVIFVPLLGAALWHRRPPLAARVGIGFAVSGLALLTLGPNLSIAWGDLVVLGCALAFALHILAVGAFVPRFEPRLLTLIQIGTVALCSALVSRVVEWPWPLLTWQVLGAALFTGVLATSLAFGVQNAAQRFTSATHTALIFTMEPVFAALSAYLLAGERLRPRHWVGCGLILVGMLMAELGPSLVVPLRWAKSISVPLRKEPLFGRRKERHEVDG
jgi:drug/metabolite transporter (DMT)-like permease